MGDVAGLVVGLVLLIFGLWLKPSLNADVRSVVGLVLVVVGLIVLILAALSFASPGYYG
jgi:multisubunit Na+/H+ antiporter MnhB subunit